MPYIFASLLLLTPLYIWRFSVGGESTNFLMIASFVVIGIAIFDIWLRSATEEFRDTAFKLTKPMLIGICLIAAASLISLFGFGFTPEKFAQWIVLYAQPLTIFFLLRYYSKRNRKVLWWFSLAVYLILMSAGILAIIQYTSLHTLPQAWWGNANEPKRAIAFFSHPNFYALFATPLLAWLLPDVVNRVKNFRQNYATKWLQISCIFAWLVAVAGLFLSLSRGSWLGLVAAAGVYVLVTANKKMFLGFIAALIILVGVVSAVPNLRYRAILPFYGEKSSVARISLWQTGADMLLTNPLFGKGINGFDDNWTEFNRDQGLDHYNFPHNIFLNFWIDLGLLGLIGFAIVLFSSAWQGIRSRQNPLAVGLLLFIVALVVHGLIDIPYLKNDLALVFWMVLGLSIAI